MRKGLAISFAAFVVVAFAFCAGLVVQRQYQIATIFALLRISPAILRRTQRSGSASDALGGVGLPQR